MCLRYFLLLLLLWYSRTVRGQAVHFPGEETRQRDGQPETRFGLKYLGYFLSLLSSSFVGYQGQPVQTPSTTPSPPVTALPIFSASPSNPPPASTGTSTAMPQVMPGAFTFPTAFPSLSAGIVTSFGTFPPVATPAPTTAPAPPILTSGAAFCGCLPLSACVNQTTRSGISVRIVTPTPQGMSCPPGLVYCCAHDRLHFCGIRNIIPGVTPGPGQANLGEFPWSAIILTDADLYVGGGALISETHVLTAAHKVVGYGNGAGLKVRLGDWDLSVATEPVQHREVQVSAIVNHPGFNPVSFANDISIIRLATPVPALAPPSPQINTVCLPQESDSFAGSRCWVAGWGKDQFNGSYQRIIKKVDVPVIPGGECQNRLRMTRLGASFVLDLKSFICAGGEVSKDACTGDGGNALACERNGQFYVAGITVGGVECGMANVPGLYTNVAGFVPWIHGVMRPPTPGIDPRRKPSS